MYRYLSLPQMLPLATPSAQMTRLISMEELTSSVIGRQNAEEARLRLLRIDPPSERTGRAPTSPSSNSSKRQSHISFNVIDLHFLSDYFTHYTHCVLFTGGRGERRRRGGQDKQRSHSYRMSLSSLHKR